VAVVPRSAELAVGDRLEPCVLLEPHDVANRVVLCLPELVVADLTRLMRAKGVLEGAGPQQAADVIGSERRTHARQTIYFSVTMYMVVSRISCGVSEPARAGSDTPHAWLVW
jgi:hypothetical protein